MKITMSDVRSIGLCSAGSRKFFKKHNLDWNEFLTNGIDQEVLLSTNDGMARWVVERLNGKVE